MCVCVLGGGGGGGGDLLNNVSEHHCSVGLIRMCSVVQCIASDHTLKATQLCCG